MKTLLVIAGLAASFAATAQTTEGKIIYEQKTNMHKHMPPEAEQWKAMVPEFTTVKMELAFKGSQSLYKAAKTDEAELPSTEGGGGGFRMMRFSAGGGNSESFKDYETGIATDVRELGPKKYLLDDTLKRVSWKMSADTMTILGHLCHKATATLKGGVMGQMQQRFGGNRGNQSQNQAPAVAGGADSSRRRNNNMFSALAQDQQVVAWYADDIASPAGPETYYGLPGVIMKLSIDDDFIVYTPLEISASAGTLKPPTNGKKITREEYNKMMQEQIQNMRGSRGGGIRIGGPM